MDVCGDFCFKDRFYFNLMALGGGPLLFKLGGYFSFESFVLTVAVWRA